MDDDILNVGIPLWFQSAQYHELVITIYCLKHVVQLESQSSRQGEAGGANCIKWQVQA